MMEFLTWVTDNPTLALALLLAIGLLLSNIILSLRVGRCNVKITEARLPMTTEPKPERIEP